jgi:uncharacterized membrane protein YagU involved in acid resistance
MCRWKDGIKLDLKQIGWESMDWIYMAQDREKSWAVVNIVMHLQFHTILGISVIAEELLASQKRLCATELVGLFVTFTFDSNVCMIL